jgi:ribosomal protein S2
MLIWQDLENVAQFRYLGTTITNQNRIQEEIKRTHLMQNRLSSRLLPKTIKIRIQKTIILPLVLYG